MPELTDFNRELQVLESELRRLEAEYNMYFAGRLPRPPVETRGRVTALVRRLDQTHISNYAERFRFASLQARFHAFIDLWERGMRSREGGRPGPFRGRAAAPPAPPPPPPPASRGPSADRDGEHVAAFRDPAKEGDKLQALYEQVAEARRAAGEDAVTYQKFASLVTAQVNRLKQQGCDEVAFRVAVKDGKVNFTARGVKGAGE